MNITDRLQTVRSLFIDTAPIVYYVEDNPRYLARVMPVFDRLDAGELSAVTSPITLAECLVVPYREKRENLRALFTELITSGNGTHFATIDHVVADKAAELRARYNLSLADALQLAVALIAGCDAFLTNDSTFSRVDDLAMIILDDFDDA